MKKSFFLGVCISIALAKCVSGVICYEYNDDYTSIVEKPCAYQCCGTDSNRYCCGSSNTLSVTGTIVISSVIPSVVGLSFIIGTIICYAKKLYCFKNRTVRPGPVSWTHTDTSQISQTHQVTQTVPPLYPSYPMYPQSTGQDFPVPIYSYSDPAYPGTEPPPSYEQAMKLQVKPYL